jgi:phosphoribosylanthranilate isomerase
VTPPDVKICGLTRRGDAEAAALEGARYLGAVFAAESPRAVSAERAARLFAGLPAHRVGVFVNSATPEVVATAGTANLDVLQLHGEEPPRQLRELRAAGPWSLWKAVRVRDAASFRAAVDRYGDHVDGILLDAWAPGARGGTGRSFAWEDVAPFRETLPTGVALVVAGGLRADNVLRAVEALRPDMLDLSSGVETAPGVKDHTAIAAVMRTLRPQP